MTDSRRTPSPYTLHYTSEDLTGGTWSVYSEQYENEAAVDKAAGPMESLTVLVSTHPTRREADAEANRLQRQTTPARTPSGDPTPTNQEAVMDSITITLDRAAADALAHAWEMDWPLATPVRVLFDGHDGFLHLLNAALGRDRQMRAQAEVCGSPFHSDASRSASDSDICPDCGGRRDDRQEITPARKDRADD